jgi:hypothetical protein
MRYQDPDDLSNLWRSVGLSEVESAPLEVEAEYDDFNDFWEPFLSGAGPGGGPIPRRSRRTARPRSERSAAGVSAIRARVVHARRPRLGDPRPRADPAAQGFALKGGSKAA